jgi:hypothetical protein
VSSFIGRDQGVSTVQQYDIVSLYPIFMKSYYHLHPLIESNNGFADKKWMTTIILDFFQMTTRNIKIAKEFIKRELLVFQPY